MVKLLADENLNTRFFRALNSRVANLDFIRVQDAGLAGIDDVELLGWCAAQERALISHDRGTMIGFAQDRIRSAQPMPGVIIVRESAELITAIEDTAAIVLCLSKDELADQIYFVPL